jgi:hypothetical protein
LRCNHRTHVLEKRNGPEGPFGVAQTRRDYFFFVVFAGFALEEAGFAAAFFFMVQFSRKWS